MPLSYHLRRVINVIDIQLEIDVKNLYWGNSSLFYIFNFLLNSMLYEVHMCFTYEVTIM